MWVSKAIGNNGPCAYYNANAPGGVTGRNGKDCTLSLPVICRGHYSPPKPPSPPPPSPPPLPPCVVGPYAIALAPVSAPAAPRSCPVGYKEASVFRINFKAVDAVLKQCYGVGLDHKVG